MQMWGDYIKRCPDKLNIGGETAAYELKSPFELCRFLPKTSTSCSGVQQDEYVLCGANLLYYIAQ